jgi:hypothetical protein
LCRSPRRSPRGVQPGRTPVDGLRPAFSTEAREAVVSLETSAETVFRRWSGIYRNIPLRGVREGEGVFREVIVK